MSHLPIIVKALKKLELDSSTQNQLLNVLCLFLHNKGYVLLEMMDYDINTFLLRLRNEKGKTFVLKIVTYIYDEHDKQGFINEVNTKRVRL